MSTSLYSLTERRPGDPRLGLPFYVGIGTEKRPRRHFREARLGPHSNPAMHAIINAHFAMGIEPEIRILAVCQDREYAGLVERRAIAVWGREGIDPGGILCNVASGGQGPDPTIMQLPGIREKIAKGQQKRTADSWERSLAALTANRANPELEERRIAASNATRKKNSEDPEKRAALGAKISAGTKGKKKTLSPAALEARRENAKKFQTPEAQVARSEGNKRRWKDPAFKAKRSKNQAAAWNDEEKRANMLAGRSEGISNSWKDPDVRARRIAGIRAAALRKSHVKEV